ncbi:MAG TPA: hypothetical protein VII24_11630, partial [Pseudolabrys sp.]
IKTATVRDRMQRDTRTMTELLPAHDPEKACPGLDPVWHTGFRTRPCENDRPTLSQLFPATADSYTALRPFGLVTRFAALHHFPRESG